MTPTEVSLVQHSFAAVFPVKSRLATTFYDKVFELAPEVRALFPKDLIRQREKLADTLAFLIKHLTQMQMLEPAMADLARKHQHLPIEMTHFDIVGTALIHALNVHTKGGMTADTQAAWAKVYGIVVDAMAQEMGLNEADGSINQARRASGG